MIRSQKSTRRMVLLVFFAISGLLQARCCPPYCANPLTPTTLDQFLTEGSYDEIITGTTAIIEQGEDAQYYADALLYYGLAQMRMANVEEAAHYLDMAEQYSDQFTNGDYELGRLYQGKMIVSAQLGDLDAAIHYRDMAIQFAPELEEEILKDAREYGIGE